MGPQLPDRPPPVDLETDLITLDDLKLELGITGTTEDAALQARITRLSDQIAEYCDRIFALIEVEETFAFNSAARMCPHGGPQPIPLVLMQYPVTEIAMLTRDGVAIDPAEYDLNSASGLLWPRAGQWSGRIVASYSGGYSLPDDAPGNLAERGDRGGTATPRLLRPRSFSAGDRPRHYPRRLLLRAAEFIARAGAVSDRRDRPLSPPVCLMAYYDTTWYCNFGNGTSTGYYAVTVRPQNTAVAAGVLRRQFTAPAVGSERVFVCIIAGTTANVTDATWVLTRGAKTTDGTATWQECTGMSAVNGDITNTVNWTAAKAAGTPTLGAIIKRNSAASYQICTTAGTMAASEPSFSDTAGVTTTDGTSVWTCIGLVGSFTGGAAPHARLANVGGTNWLAANNTIYIGNNHAELQGATMNLTLAPSGTGITKVICHNAAGSYPPASGNITTGATVSTAGAFSITFTLGWIYCYGVTFQAAVGGTTGNGSITIKGASGAGYYYFENCSFQIASSSTNQTITVGGATSSYDTIYWNNCTVKFGFTNQRIATFNCQFYWNNTGSVLVGGSSVPAPLVATGTSCAVIDAVMEALDLSQVVNLWGNIGVNYSQGTVLIKDCKLNASATVTTPGVTQQTVQFVRCDNGATAYKSARYTYEGTETTETAITRVGGATDPAAQQQSRKVVTTANSQWLMPFRAEPYAIWNATTGANVVVTVCGTINSASLPNNDDIWLEVEYLGSSSTPVGSIVTTTKASLLASNAAVASDGSTWNGGGSGAGWSPFKLTTTLSSPQPGMAGYIHARVRVGKASATYYIDPQITLT